MAGDINAAGEPDIGPGLGMFDKPLQRGDPPGAAHKTTMQTDRHHARYRGAFLVQSVKAIAQVGKKLIPGIETLGGAEAHIVGVQGVGDDQVIFAIHFGPKRQVIVVVIRVIEEAAFLHH